MKSFKEYLDEGVRYGEKRCTAVTCNAISKHHGIESAMVGPDHRLRSGADLYQHLTSHGLKLKGLGSDHVGKTVKKFVNEHPTGAHYIATRGHAMAVIDGKLHDSSGKGADGRKIWASFEVTK